MPGIEKMRLHVSGAGGVSGGAAAPAPVEVGGFGLLEEAATRGYLADTLAGQSSLLIVGSNLQ